jgi:hypothetical protein
MKYDVCHHGASIHLRMKKSQALPAVMSGKLNILRKLSTYMRGSRRCFVEQMVDAASALLGRPVMSTELKRGPTGRIPLQVGVRAVEVEGPWIVRDAW